MRRSVLCLLVACGSSPKPLDAPIPTPPPEAAIPARLVAYTSGGPNIEVFFVDEATVSLTPISSTPAFAAGASFLAIDDSVTHLYSVSEATDRVGAYSIDPATGALTFLNDVASGGSGPAHVSVDRSGHFVFAANYGNGKISVFPVTAGGIGAASQTITAGLNAHQIVTDPSNNYVFVPCLGSDHVAQYLFDDTTGTLTPNAVPTVATAANAGPRHIAFTRDGKHAYLINERDSTLTMLTLDAATGRLTPHDTVSTLPSGAASGNTTAEVAVDASGHFVYGSNRGNNSIVTFAADAAGMLSLVGHEPTTGQTPRSFAIAGNILLVANQNSGTVVPFAIDPATGMPSPSQGAPIAVTTPQFVGIVAMP